MDFEVQCKQLSERINSLRTNVQTEEATKNAFVMPFIQMLGYDVFNPNEVVPEMNCDIAKKKGEKIDYAIMQDGQPIMLIECKHWQENLSLHGNQLKRYFVASKAKFGVLTNGIVYRFYTDMVRTNIMDDVPFLEIDFSNIRDTQIEALKMFRKEDFDVAHIMDSACELKYLTELLAQFKNEFTSPSPEFTRLFARRVYDGAVTQKVLDTFSDLITRAFNLYLNNIICERLDMPIDVSTNKEREESVYLKNDEVTDLELQGYEIVKDIVRDILPGDRVVYQKNVTRFSIVADNDKHKNICWIYSRKTKVQLALSQGNRMQKFYDLCGIIDLYNYADEIKASAQKYI